MNSKNLFWFNADAFREKKKYLAPCKGPITGKNAHGWQFRNYCSTYKLLGITA